jgi:tetratricopeptide (TPR) repeat protein
MAFNRAKALEEAEKTVGQGKIAQAIRLYLAIFEKDPSDLGLLNTVGDLYVREKNMPEALKSFHKLADSYTQEGFTVKAIAIYKKITKLDPSGVEVLLKMAELYVVQGLSREAREQYTQAVDFYKKKNQNDKALEILRKIVALDPENSVYRFRYAEFCETAGKKTDALQAYVEGVEIGLRRGDTTSADNALKKALALDAKSTPLQLLRARLAFASSQNDEVQQIIESSAELKSDPAARQLLLQALLAARKFEPAKKLVVEVYRSNPADCSFMVSFAGLCIDNNELDSAFTALSDVADLMVSSGHGGPLIELLRRIWTKNPKQISNLELIYKVAEHIADELTLPEVLEALGNAYTEAKDLEKAEGVYRKLVEREPDNEQFKGMLQQVMKKEGKQAPPATRPEDLADALVALSAEPEAAPAAPPAAAAGTPEEAAAVKEALDNSDLFVRYDLAEKAFAELEKVLTEYPNQIEIHKRILEIAQKSDPARVVATASSLARIYLEKGDVANAKKYETLAGKTSAPAGHEATPVPAAPPEVAIPPQASVMPQAVAPSPAAVPPQPAAPAQPVEPPTPPTPPQPAVAEFDLSAEFLGGALSETPAAPKEEVAAVKSAPAAQEPPAPAPVQEFDLSGGWEATATLAEPSPAPPAAVAGFNYEDSKVEVEYYLEQGFADEARKTVEALETKFPGNPQVASLRQRIEQAKSPQQKTEEAVVTAPAPPTPPASHDEWDLPSSFASPAPAQTVAQAPQPIEAPPPIAPQRPSVEASSTVAQAPPPGDDLGGLIGDLEASLDGIAAAAPPPRAAAKAPEPPPVVSAPSSVAADSPLSGFLDELGEGDQGRENADDPQTHYDLGVAFREMNLLDEAIGEFQKVLKGAQKGKYPPNFLQACTLLAICFMDKKLPAIAVKWYKRALESPDLDEEATMAVQYDLGMAYEQAGEMRNALEKFSEVYSQNIDYRDVAEKIRQLQTKS